MSVICERNDKKVAFVKGSPEIISKLSRPESIPTDFYKELDMYTREGYRVIALSYKKLND